VTEMAPEPSTQLEGSALGKRLRWERERLGISLRELARRIGVSASLLSQIETGKSGPSVGTLYAIVNELALSLDELFFDGGTLASEEKARATHWRRRVSPDQGVVLRARDRKRVDLESGVHWERLTPHSTEGLDLLQIVYNPGGESTGSEALMRHSGHEYGVVLSGCLGVTVGFDEFELDVGDSISFDSTIPHRLYAVGEEPAQAFWLVVDRG
jgi:transcriptional regulator with XRE-family HTH domain